jgi:hypothetical protein
MRQTYSELPFEVIDDVLLVDDSGSDATVELSHELGLSTFRHQMNLGYGGNQKTCYRKALKVSSPTKYFEEASSIGFMRSVKYGIGFLATSLKVRDFRKCI